MAGCIKKQQIITFLIVLAFVFNSACQPTPTPNITAPVNSDATPPAYEREVELSDRIRLVISASVTAPEGPFVQTDIERLPVDASFVEKIVQALSDDPAYYMGCEIVPELTLHLMTYMRQLESARSKLSQSDIQVNESVIANMQRALASAPETEPVISLAQAMEMEEARINTGNEIKAWLVISKNNRRDFVRVSNHRWKDVMVEDVPGLKITEEDALRQATDILCKLGIEGEFSLVATKYSFDGYTLIVNALNQAGLANYPYDHRIRLFFMRDIGGQKQVYSEQVSDGTWASEFMSTAFWEMIEMDFDNDGLVSFSWDEPCETAIDTSDTQVIGLEAAADAMCAYMKVSQNKYAYGGTQGVTIRIDRIELGMTCILGENRTRIAIPVWEFYGNVEYTNSAGETAYVLIDGAEEGRISDKPWEYCSLCTIDARTGKRIDRGLGY